jgi:hypothetical protein
VTALAADTLDIPTASLRRRPEGEETTMCPDHTCRMDFETLLADPLTRALMDSDGVSETELIAVLELARDARIGEDARAG